LGRSLENLLSDNMTYEEYVLSNQLIPIKMESSGFNFTPEIISRMAMGDGTRSVFADSGYDNPNGQMYASVNDLGRFLITLLRNNRETSIFDQTSVMESMLPRYVFPDGTTAIGMPWEMQLVNNYWRRSKLGNFDGFASSITLVPELSVGIALCNNQGDNDADIFTAPIMADLISFLNQTIPVFQNKPPMPSNPTMFVGTYVSPEDGRVVISVDNTLQILNASVFGALGQLRWLHDAQFIFSQFPSKDDCLGIFYDNYDGVAIWFQINEKTGVVDSLTLPGSTFWDHVFTRV